MHYVGNCFFGPYFMLLWCHLCMIPLQTLEWSRLHYSTTPNKCTLCEFLSLMWEFSSLYYMSHESIRCSSCTIFSIGPCFLCPFGFLWIDCLHFFLKFFITEHIYKCIVENWFTCKISILRNNLGCSFTREMLSYAEQRMLEFGTSTCMVHDSACIWFQIAECCDCSRAHKRCHMFRLQQRFRIAVFCICVSFRGFNRSNSYHLSH